MTGESQYQYERKYHHLYSALKRGDFSLAKEMLSSDEQTFVNFMDNYISEHGLVRQTILRRADVPVAVGYKYLSGAKRTKQRNVIIRLCIAMEMKEDDVQTALELYGMNPLGRGRRDSVIKAGIENRATVDEIDEWLCELAEEGLLDRYDR